MESKVLNPINSWDELKEGNNYVVSIMNSEDPEFSKMMIGAYSFIIGYFEGYLGKGITEFKDVEDFMIWVNYEMLEFHSSDIQICKI